MGGIGGIWLVAMLGEIAGPQLPPAQKITPAQQAIALYHQQQDPAPLPQPCRQGSHEEITICGKAGDRSPDRIPLPDEHRVRAGPRTATGELPSTAGGVGGSPALQGKGAGLTLTVKPGSTNIGGNADD